MGYSFRGRLFVALALAMAALALALIWYNRYQQESTILYACYGTTQWEICTTPPP
jgi:hypothetical protein